jgi:hypothetical protein
VRCVCDYAFQLSKERVRVIFLLLHFIIFEIQFFSPFLCGGRRRLKKKQTLIIHTYICIHISIQIRTNAHTQTFTWEACIYIYWHKIDFYSAVSLLLRSKKKKIMIFLLYSSFTQPHYTAGRRSLCIWNSATIFNWWWWSKTYIFYPTNT